MTASIAAIGAAGGGNQFQLTYPFELTRLSHTCDSPFCSSRCRRWSSFTGPKGRRVHLRFLRFEREFSRSKLVCGGSRVREVWKKIWCEGHTRDSVARKGGVPPPPAGCLGPPRAPAARGGDERARAATGRGRRHIKATLSLHIASARIRVTTGLPF